jgi:hypothetical protein
MGRTVAVSRERRQVHARAAPHPMQKNSCFSTSNATMDPQPQAAGFGKRRARISRWRAAGTDTSGEPHGLTLSSTMGITRLVALY